MDNNWRVEQVDGLRAEVARLQNENQEMRRAVAEWRGDLIHAWAEGHPLVMTALLEAGPEGFAQQRQESDVGNSAVSKRAIRVQAGRGIHPDLDLPRQAVSLVPGRW
jgi:hypothetical protein